MGKLWGNMDFYVETGNFVDFFIHILADFAVSFWAFPYFFLLFLVLPFYCFILPAYTVPGK